jgi:oligosaccharyltransferase complex subunit beta
LFSLIFAQDSGPGGKRVLAILGDLKIKSTHSKFFRNLEDSGYTIDYVSAEARAALSTYGEWNYDNLIVFAPGASDLARISTREILEFVDAGHNLVVAADSTLDEPIRELASECNIEFDDQDTHVIDHFHFDADDEGDHTLLAVDTYPKDLSIVFPTKIEAPVLFRGVGQDIEEDSALLFSVLSGYSTTYSHSRTEPVKQLHVSGSKTSLVTALQARNNARAIFSGSLELFSDKFFNSDVEVAGKKYEKSGNEEFTKNIISWAFQERGILRYKNLKHHLVGEKEAPELYTIKDHIEFSIELEEWKGRRWIPFNANDVQLEFSMIDPHIRTTLKNDGKGKYSTIFEAPDRYGVFTFRIQYIRRGFGFLTAIERVPVRPFRHNQYERFIDAAYPYYLSAFSMMVGLYIFSWVFLYHREKK